MKKQVNNVIFKNIGFFNYNDDLGLKEDSVNNALSKFKPSKEFVDEVIKKGKIT